MFSRRYIPAIVSVALLTGCSSKPVVTAKLQNVQNAYQKMISDPNVTEKAPLALFQAGKIYDLSFHAKDKEEANHLSYLLERELEVVKESARKTDLEDRIERLKTEKQKAELEAKETELLLMKKKMEQAEAKLNEMEELNAKQTNRGLVLTLGDVLFETGKATLLPGAQRAIDKLAEFLEENPERKVLIEGYTDNSGSVTYNIDLSLRRAQAVKNALVEKGIDLKRVLAHGYGEAYPIALNDDEAGRQRNRRVEIIILKKGVEPVDMMR
ncbi:MAG: flagellar motor protein MotB [Sulfurospirillum sp.]|nr:MAG: flagellar motor protein MotB [Sulfurospirillum sp.]